MISSTAVNSSGPAGVALAPVLRTAHQAVYEEPVAGWVFSVPILFAFFEAVAIRSVPLLFE
jgi:hypothetical protein